MAQNNINPVVSGLTQAFGIANQIKRMALEEEEAARRERETILREKQSELDQEQQERDFALRAPQLGLRPADGLAKADAMVDMIPDPENPSKLIPNPRKGRIVKSPGGNDYIVPSDQEMFNRELQRTAQVEGVKADEFIRRYTAQQQAQLEREKAIEATRIEGRKEVEDVRQGAATKRSEAQIKAANDRTAATNASRERAAKLKKSTSGTELSPNTRLTKTSQLRQNNLDIDEELVDLEAEAERLGKTAETGKTYAQQDGEFTEIELPAAMRKQLADKAKTIQRKIKAKKDRKAANERQLRLLEGGSKGDDIDESVLDDILKEVQSK